MYIGDQANFRIRSIERDGIIRTVAGNGMQGLGGDGGPATNAMFRFERGQAANPSGRLALDASENMYIADTGNHVIRRVDKASGIISTVAGEVLKDTAGQDSTSSGYAGDGGQATAAKLNDPRDIAVDTAGNLYIADTGNYVIRRVDTSGIITTIAGTGSPGYTGEAGPATQAAITSVYGIEIGPAGNLWISDLNNCVIRVLVLQR